MRRLDLILFDYRSSVDQIPPARPGTILLYQPSFFPSNSLFRQLL